MNPYQPATDEQEAFNPFAPAGRMTPKLERMLAAAGASPVQTLRYIGPQYYDYFTSYQQGLIPTAGFY